MCGAPGREDGASTRRRKAHNASGYSDNPQGSCPALATHVQQVADASHFSVPRASHSRLGAGGLGPLHP